jgi:hypothetical protein
VRGRATGVGPAGAKRGDNVLAGNHLTTGSAAICTTHIFAFGLFQFDVEMLTEWWVILLGPPSLYLSCFSLSHATPSSSSAICANPWDSYRPTGAWGY